MKPQAVQYTIRGIPQEVDRLLKERAKNRKVSINQLVVEELTKATIGEVRFGDFSDLVGRWKPDPQFDEAIESQRQVNPDDWR